MLAQCAGLVIAALVLSACSNEHMLRGEREEEEVLRFFANRRFSSPPDVGLMKRSAFAADEWHHVAVIWGMQDDMKFCQTLASLLQEEFPDEEYGCSIVSD